MPNMNLSFVSTTGPSNSVLRLHVFTCVSTSLKNDGLVGFLRNFKFNQEISEYYY